jgi:hypothetical protein
MIDKGDFAGAGQAVVNEIAALGGSPAEIETARNLSALAVEHSTDPAWVQWSRDMLAWVHALRNPSASNPSPRQSPGMLSYPNTKV